MPENMDEMLVQTSTPEGRRLWYREKTYLDITETLCDVMQRNGVSRSELAKRANMDESLLDVILDNPSVTTLADLVDLFTALGVEWKTKAIPIESLTDK